MRVFGGEIISRRNEIGRAFDIESVLISPLLLIPVCTTMEPRGDLSTDSTQTLSVVDILVGSKQLRQDIMRNSDL